VEFFEDPSLAPKSISDDGWVVTASVLLAYSESGKKLYSFFSALP
jgi:hypothetical protein